MRNDCPLPPRALDTLDDVFYVYDERGELAVWNDRLPQLFGLTDEELSGMRPMDFFVERDRPAVEQALTDVFEHGRAVVEARAETEEGVIVFELTANRLTDDDGDVVGFCGIGRDVTAHREQERLLAAQNDRLNSFANVLAHDIRNPLNVAMGILDLADAEATELRRATEALERIEQIVDEVLVLAVEGQPVVADTPVDVPTVVRDAWRTVDTGNATLDVRTDLVVRGDEARLRRLFENLFRNSVEHGATSSRTASDDGIARSSTGGRASLRNSAEHGFAGRQTEADDGTNGRGVDDHTPSITVVVEDTATGFAVGDDGPGIAPEDVERVFETGVTTNPEGTGFGLPIVRAIADAHGWTVVVADTDRGARFEFEAVPDADAERFSVGE